MKAVDKKRFEMLLDEISNYYFEKDVNRLRELYKNGELRKFIKEYKNITGCSDFDLPDWLFRYSC